VLATLIALAARIDDPRSAARFVSYVQTVFAEGGERRFKVLRNVE